MRKKPISKRSLAKADAAARTALEGEAPPLGSDFFERARIRVGEKIVREGNGTLTRRGRPPLGERPKVQQSLRLSPEVIEFFRSSGQGWQARIDEVLRQYIEGARMRSAVAEEHGGYRTTPAATADRAWKRPRVRRLKAGEADRPWDEPALLAS
jgi:uncharacterized protein (DUF4415 family)